MEYAKYFDHTLLKQDASPEAIDKLCLEAKEYGFASVCVNPCFVDRCYKLLKDTDVKVCTVIGFPLGANKTFIKVKEAQDSVFDGATEVDMVINVGWLKDGKHDLLLNEIKAIRAALDGN